MAGAMNYPLLYNHLTHCIRMRRDAVGMTARHAALCYMSLEGSFGHRLRDDRVSIKPMHRGVPVTVKNNRRHRVAAFLFVARVRGP